LEYIAKHWQGNLSLKTTFWINFVGLLVILHILEPALLSRFTNDLDLFIKASIISLLISKLIIYPWQLIGLLRANDRNYIIHRNIITMRAVQVVIVVSIFIIMAYIVGAIQDVYILKSEVEFYSSQVKTKGYKLSIQKDGSQLVLKGSMDIGITRSARDVIESNPGIKSILLESPGGQIYQGRGIAKLIADYQLDTYTFNECSSACVTAYISGKRRYLGSFGQIGFHQYRFESASLSHFKSFYENLKSQQQRDLEIFKSQGVTQPFLNKMFDQETGKIWFPDQSELLDANIVHFILDQKSTLPKDPKVNNSNQEKTLSADP